jgi:hypothetical protein
VPRLYWMESSGLLVRFAVHDHKRGARGIASGLSTIHSEPLLLPITPFLDRFPRPYEERTRDNLSRLEIWSHRVRIVPCLGPIGFNALRRPEPVDCALLT